jgi:hypothetical protein
MIILCICFLIIFFVFLTLVRCLRQGSTSSFLKEKKKDLEGLRDLYLVFLTEPLKDPLFQKEGVKEAYEEELITLMAYLEKQHLSLLPSTSLEETEAFNEFKKNETLALNTFHRLRYEFLIKMLALLMCVTWSYSNDLYALPQFKDSSEKAEAPSFEIPPPIIYKENIVTAPVHQFILTPSKQGFFHHIRTKNKHFFCLFLPAFKI